MSINNILSWTFFNETTVPEDLKALFTEGEYATEAFKTIRDVAVFTNKRLIVADSQGLTGRKKEIYSLPYSSILMWSTENAGTFDLDAEVELWTRMGNVKISLKKGVDVRKFDQLIAEAVL